MELKLLTWDDYASSVAVDSDIDAGDVSGAVNGSTMSFAVNSGDSYCEVDSGTGRGDRGCGWKL